MSGDDQDRNLEQRAGEAVAAIDDLIQRLNKVGLSWERLERWEQRGRPIIMHHFGEEEAERFVNTKGSLRFGFPEDNFASTVRAKREFLTALKEATQEDPRAYLTLHEATQTAPEAPPIAAVPRTGRVFIVHGHDEINRERLRAMIREEFRLEPVVLLAEPGRSRTTIEKLEAEGATCAYAIALMTPDDEVHGVQQNDSGEEVPVPYKQARPNVHFELGWFAAKLGRNQTCMIVKRGTHIPSDFEGIDRIDFDKNVEEVALRIKRELVAAGLIKKD